MKFKQLYFLIYQQLFKKRCQNDTNCLSSRNKSKSVSRNWISFSWKLLKKYIEITVTFWPINIMSKKVSQNNIDFWFIETASNKVHRNNVHFCPAKLRGIKYVKRMSIFCPSKLRQRNHVELKSIFCPFKIRRRKHIETTSIFRPLKLHKMLKFVNIFSSTYWCNIILELTPIRCGVSVGMFVRLINI